MLDRRRPSIHVRIWMVVVASLALIDDVLVNAFSCSSSLGNRKERQQQYGLFMTQEKDDEQSHHQQHPHQQESFLPSRRQVLQQTVAATTTLAATTVGLPLPAQATLISFPCIDPSTGTCTLKNRYHFLRAGQSLSEHADIYATNPLFLTNREHALDEHAQEPILQACKLLKNNPHLFPTVAYHSLAAHSMDTGDLVARTLQLPRDRLLPEFTYLDQRGIGAWDGTPRSMTEPALWALDEQSAGPRGMGPASRPPPNEDGTPNETLADAFCRLRQFVSLQESRTSGETILIIFPDGTGPALLSCMIAGIPFSKCHALQYAPGELRVDVTPQSVLELYEQRVHDPAYVEAIEKGKENLIALQAGKVPLVKDPREADDEEEAERQAQAALLEKKRREQQVYAEQQQQQQKKRQEEALRKKEQEETERKQRQQAAALAKPTAPVARRDISTSELGLAGMAVAMVGGLGWFGTQSASPIIKDESQVLPLDDDKDPPMNEYDDEDRAVEEIFAVDNDDDDDASDQGIVTIVEPQIAVTSKIKDGDNLSMDDTMDSTKNSLPSSTSADADADERTESYSNKVSSLDDLDDGAAAWLQVLAEIRDEDYDDDDDDDLVGVVNGDTKPATADKTNGE